jgi:hypothetical protein
MAVTVLAVLGRAVAAVAAALLAVPEASAVTVAMRPEQTHTVAVAVAVRATELVGRTAEMVQ